MQALIRSTGRVLLGAHIADLGMLAGDTGQKDLGDLACRHAASRDGHLGSGKGVDERMSPLQRRIDVGAGGLGFGSGHGCFSTHSCMGHSGLDPKI